MGELDQRARNCFLEHYPGQLPQYRFIIGAYKHGANEQKVLDYEKAWDYFKCDVRQNYIHRFGHEPSDGYMEKYKMYFMRTMEGQV